jgi:hypothetical protein
MASMIPVNADCLIDEPDRAIETAKRFSVEQPEPGPYAVVEIFVERTPHIASAGDTP